MLTAKQKELLSFIKERVSKEGVPPSFDEMKKALGLHSKSGIHRLITGLEERGFIRRLPHRARALEILKLPESVVSKAMRASSAREEEMTIPLYGRIAAGTPIEALRDPSSHIEVPPSVLMARKGGSDVNAFYALEVAGDSMIEAGIMDGDHVIIRKADVAENGAIVVALVDENEATLKYLERRNGQIALVPANQSYETRVLSPDRVKVQGQLVGLIRKY